MDIRHVHTIIISFALFFTATSSALEAVPGEFIVRYKEAKNTSQALGKTSLRYNLSLKRSWNSINTHHFKTRADQDDESTLSELKNDPDVLYAEPNYYVQAQDLNYFPTDAPIKAPESWAVGNADPQAVVPIVAILDSGVDVEHEIFKDTGRLWENSLEANGAPGIDDDGNGLIDDINGWNFLNNNSILTDGSGHGTHVAGIVVASTEDLPTVSSMTNPKVRIMVLKFLDENGVGTTSNAINAIYYAVDKGAKVLNNSWGGEGYSSSLHEAIVHSFFKNTLFVAAAGNNQSNNDSTPIYPASYDVPNVISVGASDDSDDRAFFSNYGSQSVDVSAPGVNIVSTAPGGGYYSSSGTSMSAPFVAGLGALLTREAPHFSGYQLRRDILNSSDVSSGLANASSSQARVNFLSAVQLVQANSSEATYSPDYTPEYLFASKTLASEAEDSGFGCGRVKALYKNHNSGKGHLGNKSGLLILSLICLPLVLLGFVRRKLEVRAHERVEVDLKAELINSLGSIEVKVFNLSLGGAGVKFPENCSALKKIMLSDESYTLKVDFGSGKKKDFQCKSVSRAKGVLGLSFLKL